MINLRDLRLKRGLTQQELAAKTGIGQGVISGIESGATQNPRFDTVVKLAEALDCSLSDFLQSDSTESKAV